MSATLGKSSKMLALINYRMKVTLQDGRSLVGIFMAFDKHMNMVLGECEEFRRVKAKRGGGGNPGSDAQPAEQRRYLGLVLLRGENVVSLSVAGPPKPRKKAADQPSGPGTAQGVGRGFLPPQSAGARMGVGLPSGPHLTRLPGGAPPGAIGRGRPTPAWQLQQGAGGS